MPGSMLSSSHIDIIIVCVKGTLNILNERQISKSETLFNNTILNYNVNTFPSSQDESELLQTLTETIENIVNDILPTINDESKKYLFDMLHEYHYDRVDKKFEDSLTTSSLPAFLNDLESTDASLKAFQAAWNGEIDPVKTFINKYPQYKDKSGIKGTTLLYSATRKKHLELVKYLVEEAKCSIDAQNEQHIEMALTGSGGSAPDFKANPLAGSSALHAACYYGYLDIAKYLVEHGADYYLKNHAGETAISNALEEPLIKEYFENYLILGYFKEIGPLPIAPIIEGGQKLIDDCVWEYKPFQDSKWYSFSANETKLLSKSLRIPPNEEFQLEIHLRVPKGIYGVSIVKFLRSGRNLNFDQNLAWIRCRGSSILNFDCYSLWQIIIDNNKFSSSMQPLNFPSLSDQDFTLQENIWYNCPEKINSQINRAINYRQKYLTLKFPFLSDQLKVNLQAFTFTFTKNSKTFSGFLRWIPKIVSINEYATNKITYLDNFQPMTGSKPILLTSEHQRTLMAMDDSNLENLGVHEMIDDVDDENTYSNDYNTPSDGENAYNFKAMNEDINFASQAMDEIFNTTTSSRTMSLIDSDDSTKYSSKSSPIEIQTRGSSKKTITADSISASSSASSVDDLTCSKLLEANATIEKLQGDKALLEDEIRKFIESNQIKTKQYTKELSELQTKLKKIEDERKTMEEEQQRLKNEKTRLEQENVRIKQIKAEIKTVDYRNVQSEIIDNCLAPCHSLLIKTLKNISTIQGVPLVDDPLQLTFEKYQMTYTITVTGFPDHHNQFTTILQKIKSATTGIQSAKDYYQRVLKRMIQSLMMTFSKVQSKLHYWFLFKKIFSNNIQEKSKDYITMFNTFIDQKLRTLGEQCILGTITQPWKEIRKFTNQFIEDNPFMSEVEGTKHQTLDQFIKENISLKKIETNKKPTENSIRTIQNLLKKMTKIFKTKSEYRDHELEQLQLIPDLLQQIMIYYCCFTLQLPLFESTEDLLGEIEKNTVTTITTTTGSGKSTLLPALLIAEGYDKVIVTQPRRLPCQLISNRVNETMTVDTHVKQEQIAGWIVSGAQKNPGAKILYMTDGFLRERLLYDDSMVPVYRSVKKSIVIFLDEVHERSINIDLCLAFLARLLTNYPQLKHKLKLIISSATLDKSVPNLFRNIPQVSLGEFSMPQLGTLHTVTKYSRPNTNILDIVQELYKKCKMNDQILCFVNSALEAVENCKLLSEITRNAINARPLIQSQTTTVQQENIAQASVLFSTTIAETSLTFPSLKYVIDTGYINLPIYNPELQRTILTTMRAAHSTIKQRLGRVGRTQPGEYYALYNYDPEELSYPVPHICQSDLTNIEYSLRRSPLKCGLHVIQKFLPDKPVPQYIDSAINVLRDLKILEKAPSQDFTNVGKLLSRVPEFGTIQMSVSVLAALREFDCGHDLICLSSILGVLNSTAIFSLMPPNLKSSDGDFMTLLNIMNKILSVKESISTSQFNLNRICEVANLTQIRHIIGPALRRYSSLEKSFNISDYRIEAHKKSGQWESIAKALLAGYSDNVFISMRELQEKNLLYARYNDKGDLAVLDIKSILTRPVKQDPVPLVVARDVFYSTAVRSRAIISFVGEIKIDWMTHSTKRELTLTDEEEIYLNSNNRYGKVRQLYSHNIQMLLSNKTLKLTGRSDVVLNAELQLRKEMITELTFKLENRYSPNTTKYKNLANNLEKVSKMPNIFHPMIWRWESEKQVKITVDNNTSAKTCDIKVVGRPSEIAKVKQEFDSFLSWLSNCAVLRDPDAGVSPRILQPTAREKYRDVEERIARITDIKSTRVDLFNATKGSQATRESRMEAVLWIAVCKFDCKVEGGFVRDWVVGNYRQRSTTITKPSDWITYGTDKIPSIIKEVVPSDLDCHLPKKTYFDIEKFKDELHKLGISCDVHRESWRYVLLIDKDEKSGPFTMDLIEPHIALTHDRIDLDVNNLYLEKGYTREIGMRVDIQELPYSISLESIVKNIDEKKFRVLRPIDSVLEDRINKMTNIRKWTQVGKPFSVIPSPHSHVISVVVPLPSSSDLYQDLATKMQVIGSGIQIISIEQIRNPQLEGLYEFMKTNIAGQCPQSNPKERYLYHGTAPDAVQGITDFGFDDRYFSSDGLWGHGAYFAEDPRKSHDYAPVNPQDQTRVMFYAKVLLGIQSVQDESDPSLNAAPIGYHSVQGTGGKYEEYIVYRYGQALPY
ncbi:unnamed protein product, partial [Rotaria sp. Silwood1]